MTAVFDIVLALGAAVVILGIVGVCLETPCACQSCKDQRHGPCEGTPAVPPQLASPRAAQADGSPWRRTSARAAHPTNGRTDT